MSSPSPLPPPPSALSPRMLSEIEDYDDDDDDDAEDVDTDVTYDNDDTDDDDDEALKFTPVPSSPAKQRSRRLYGQDIILSGGGNSNNNSDTNNTTNTNTTMSRDGRHNTSNNGSNGNVDDNSHNSHDDIPPPPHPPHPFFPPPVGRYSTMSSLAYSTASTTNNGGGGGLNDSLLLGSSLWDSANGGGGSWYFHPTTHTTSMVLANNSANNNNSSSTNSSSNTNEEETGEGGGAQSGGSRGGDVVNPIHNNSMPSHYYPYPGLVGSAVPPHMAYWMMMQQQHYHHLQQQQQQQQLGTESNNAPLILQDRQILSGGGNNNDVNHPFQQQQSQCEQQYYQYHHPQQLLLHHEQPPHTYYYHHHHHAPNHPPPAPTTSYPDLSHLLPPSTDDAFTIYNTRWVMLLYMSLLNLLSDWTCYSVAPIALLTMNAFGDVDAESLVTVFLSANAIASALEPAILGRLGLRRTILFGGFLLTLGSIVKSGGLSRTLLMGASYSANYTSSLSSSSTDIDGGDISSTSGNGGETWRLYLGFFLVGLSQPLYQCTPALLSASWFPENERTMATGVALNSNQLGIGCAFVFGTMLVSTEEDIMPYFGLLSLISTLTFVGCALQFDDAPPTPPSDTARVIRGDLEIKIPKHWPIIGRFGRRSTVVNSRVSSIIRDDKNGVGGGGFGGDSSGGRERITINFAVDAGAASASSRTDSARTESSDIDAIREWEAKVQDTTAPSRASTEESVEDAMAAIPNWNNAKKKQQNQLLINAMAHAPSPTSTDEPVVGHEEEQNPSNVEGIPFQTPSPHHDNPPTYPHMASPEHPFATPSPYYYPNPYIMSPPPPPSSGYYQPFPFAHSGMGNSITTTSPSFYHGYDEMGHYHNALLESTLGFGDYRTRSLVGIETDDEGVEPIMTQVDRQLDIDIRDDQLIQQFKACFRRKGFSHCVVAFTTSGIIINTLSTYMDYLVTLNGAGREYVGIVGGTFQILIMCSSLVFGGWTDASRKYYFVTLAMLIFGAFALAVCNVNLDSNAGGDLRWNLLTVAVLAGPLQPISTELGVEVVYPLSENTVLVIQQLFSNLLSAAFIPIFKALRDVGNVDASEIEDISSGLPQYTFSFYMLIIISAVATCYFATFNGTYLRYEAEEARKAEKESEREKLLSELQQQHGYGSAPVQ